MFDAQNLYHRNTVNNTWKDVYRSNYGNRRLWSQHAHHWQVHNGKCLEARRLLVPVSTHKMFSPHSQITSGQLYSFWWLQSSELKTIHIWNIETKITSNRLQYFPQHPFLCLHTRLNSDLKVPAEHLRILHTQCDTECLLDIKSVSLMRIHLQG